MIAASLPSLTLAFGLWIFVGTGVALVAALFAGAVASDTESDRTCTIIAGITFLVVWAFTAVATILIHAAAWEDYRRSVGR